MLVIMPYVSSDKNVINYNKEIISYIDLLTPAQISTYILLREISTSSKDILSIENEIDLGITKNNLSELAKNNLIKMSEHVHRTQVEILDLVARDSPIHDIIPCLKIKTNKAAINNKAYFLFVNYTFKTILGRAPEKSDLTCAFRVIKNFIKNGYTFDDVRTTVDYVIERSLPFKGFPSLYSYISEATSGEEKSRARTRSN